MYKLIVTLGGVNCPLRPLIDYNDAIMATTVQLCKTREVINYRFIEQYDLVSAGKKQKETWLRDLPHQRWVTDVE